MQQQNTAIRMGLWLFRNSSSRRKRWAEMQSKKRTWKQNAGNEGMKEKTNQFLSKFNVFVFALCMSFDHVFACNLKNEIHRIWLTKCGVERVSASSWFHCFDILCVADFCSWKTPSNSGRLGFCENPRPTIRLNNGDLLYVRHSDARCLLLSRPLLSISMIISTT